MNSKATANDITAKLDRSIKKSNDAQLALMSKTIRQRMDDDKIPYRIDKLHREILGHVETIKTSHVNRQDIGNKFDCLDSHLEAIKDSILTGTEKFVTVKLEDIDFVGKTEQVVGTKVKEVQKTVEHTIKKMADEEFGAMVGATIQDTRDKIETKMDNLLAHIQKCGDMGGEVTKKTKDLRSTISKSEEALLRVQQASTENLNVRLREVANENTTALQHHAQKAADRIVDQISTTIGGSIANLQAEFNNSINHKLSLVQVQLMDQINASKQMANEVVAELIESFKATESRHCAFLEELQDKNSKNEVGFREARTTNMYNVQSVRIEVKHD